MYFSDPINPGYLRDAASEFLEFFRKNPFLISETLEKDLKNKYRSLEVKYWVEKSRDEINPKEWFNLISQIDEEVTVWRKKNYPNISKIVMTAEDKKVIQTYNSYLEKKQRINRILENKFL